MDPVAKYVAGNKLDLKDSHDRPLSTTRVLLNAARYIKENGDFALGKFKAAHAAKNTKSAEKAEDGRTFEGRMSRAVKALDSLKKPLKDGESHFSHAEVDAAIAALKKATEVQVKKPDAVAAEALTADAKKSLRAELMAELKEAGLLKE